MPRKAPGKAPRPIADRLKERLAIDPSSGCHVWRGQVNKGGYGHIGVGSGSTKRTLRTHRLAYELAKGPIPPGLTIDHLCRERLCCNPEHLEAVTAAVNALRGTGPAAINAQRTHCKRGHEFTPENTGVGPSGRRRCRTCRRLRMRRIRARETNNG